MDFGVGLGIGFGLLGGVPSQARESLRGLYQYFDRIRSFLWHGHCERYNRLYPCPCSVLLSRMSRAFFLSTRAIFSSILAFLCDFGNVGHFTTREQTKLSPYENVRYICGSESSESCGVKVQNVRLPTSELVLASAKDLSPIL